MNRRVLLWSLLPERSLKLSYQSRLFIPILIFAWLFSSFPPSWQIGTLFGIQKAAAADITYIYDELGRLRAVVDPASDTAVYSYDSVGNLTGITRQPSSQVSIIDFTPNSGPVGTTVTIYGTGFSPIVSQNTITFNGAAATVSSATASQITTTVPSGATTGPIAVTTPTGSATSAAMFTVTSPTGAPTITSFSPTIGIAGTAVTITGTNFQTTAANNNVTFNVTRGTVNSATVTTIAASVAIATGSGRISVSTPPGKATSSGDFFIPPPPYAAADVAFTDRIAFGQSKIVTIGTANKVGLVVFDGTAGQRISLLMNGVTMGSSRVSIYDPHGTAFVSPTSISSGGGFFEPISLPITGTYTIMIDPDGTNTGNMALNLYNVTDITGTITPGGSSVNVNLTAPGQRVLLSFGGTANQKISAFMSNSTISSCWVYSMKFSILKPDGTELTAVTFCGGNSAFIEPIVLPVTGTYTLVLDPPYAATGQATLNLYSVTDVTGTITANGPAVNVNLPTPGQRALLTFSGTANQKISAFMSNSTISSCWVNSMKFSILKPDGSQLTAVTFCGGNSAFIEPIVLPVTGTYTLVLDPPYVATGQATLNLYNVVDTTGTVIPNGPAVNVNLPTPGQRALLTFSGTANQSVSAFMSNSTINPCWSYSMKFSILKPDGTQLTAVTFCSGTSASLGPVNLPVTGTFTLVLDPPYMATGQATLSMTSP
jgi:YD repeat-containing protein